MHDFDGLKLDPHIKDGLITPLAANLILKLCS